MPEDLSKFFEPMLDPLLAVERSRAAQAGPPDAATHAVIPTSYGGVDELGTRDRQGWISWDDGYRLTTLMTRVHLGALGTGEHHQRCLCALCGPWATIWFPASRQAQPYRKLYGRSPGPMPAWFKTPAIRVTVLALSTGVGSCSGFCLPRSGGISLPGGASPRVGAVGSEPPILLTRTPNGGDSSTRAGPGVDCDQAPLGTP